MAKAILICGKICSGKSTFARSLQEELGAVILSCDEIENDIFHKSLGEAHDRVAADIEAYLQKKAVEITKAGVPVILDWGFWQRARRAAAEAYFRERGVETEWHYVEVTDEEWQRNICARNEAVTKGETDDYFVDEGLFQKIVSLFEPPAPGEMSVIRNPKQ